MEAQLGQIETADKRIDEADGIVLSDIIFDSFGKEDYLIACDAAYEIHQPASSRLRSRTLMIIRSSSNRVFTQSVVGRERNQRACHRQLVRNAVVSRRVNSTVRAHRSFKNDRLNARLVAMARRAALW